MLPEWQRCPRRVLHSCACASRSTATAKSESIRLRPPPTGGLAAAALDTAGSEFATSPANTGGWSTDDATVVVDHGQSPLYQAGGPRPMPGDLAEGLVADPRRLSSRMAPQQPRRRCP